MPVTLEQTLEVGLERKSWPWVKCLQPNLMCALRFLEPGCLCSAHLCDVLAT